MLGRLIPLLPILFLLGGFFTGHIALLTAVFQGAMGNTRPLIGTNFPLFYASGYLVFQMYHDIANKVATSLRFSRPLLAYPAVTFVDALLARVAPAEAG